MSDYPYINPAVQTDVPQPDAETRLVLNHQTGRYVRLGKREHSWLLRLDGRTAREDVASRLEVDEATAVELLSRMERARLILFSPEPIEALLSHESAQTVQSRTFEWTSFGQLRISIPGARRVLDPVTRLKGVLCNPILILASVLIAALGTAAGIRLLQVENFQQALTAVTRSPWQLALLVALVFATTIVHEFGHAVACTLCGASVRSMGFMVFYLQPAAFADVTDSWRLSNKWHRAIISAAGVWVQATVNAFAVALALVQRSSLGHNPVLLVYIALNFSMMVFNLVPFVRLDGYWILSAVLGIPNLRDRSLEWLQVSVAAMLPRQRIQSSALRFPAVLSMSPLGRTLLAGYGMSCRAFSVAMWSAGVSFLFAVGRWVGVRGAWNFGFVAVLLAATGGAFVLPRLRRMRRPASANRPAATRATPIIPPPRIADTQEIRLNPFANILDDRKGKLTVAWVSPQPVVLSATKELEKVLPLLRKGTTLRALQEALGGEIDPASRDAIARLWYARHLRDSAEWDASGDDERYSRQLGWMSFNPTVRGSEKAALARLRSASVTVLGAGGVGSNVALNLAACGVGEIHLVDGDNVEVTNLNRQLLYRPSDVGRPKVEVAAERIVAFNPSVRVRTSNMFLRGVGDISRVIQGASFVVRAIDTPDEAQVWINEACVRASIPSIGAGFVPQGAIIGPTVVPGKTACLQCSQTELPRLDRGIGPTYAPVVSLTSAMVANEVAAYLAGLGDPKTMEGMFLIEAPSLAIRFQSVPKNEKCPVCSAPAKIEKAATEAAETEKAMAVAV